MASTDIKHTVIFEHHERYDEVASANFIAAMVRAVVADSAAHNSPYCGESPLSLKAKYSALTAAREELERMIIANSVAEIRSFTEGDPAA